jgi:steroid delta-isomerase-like uncharacterized protein
MATEQNKKIIQRLFKEVMNEQKFNLIDEFISNSFINHGLPNSKPGQAGFREILQMMTKAFPDMKVTAEQYVAEGDSVATRGYWTGTHNSDFMNFPATGKKVKVAYVDFWKITNGKITENWVQMDMAAAFKPAASLQTAL